MHLDPEVLWSYQATAERRITPELSAAASVFDYDIHGSDRADHRLGRFSATFWAGSPARPIRVRRSRAGRALGAE
jgi:hypothetical protein